ncbi:MAG TPA: hypothetical protein PLK34_01610, partial [Candidatus Pacearchaeota archaeon]|nr:hypothetical protein [Candidatus Pacearchaeota archaeon]
FSKETTMSADDFENVMNLYLRYQEYEIIKEGYMGKKILGFITIKTGTSVTDYTCQQLTEHPIWSKVFDYKCTSVVDFCDEEGELKGAFVERANPELWGYTVA